MTGRISLTVEKSPASVKRENKFNHDMKQLRLNLSVKLGYKTEEDWYVVSPKSIVDCGGKSFLCKRNTSLVSLIKAMFPKYEWLDWKFKRSPDGLWGSMETRKKYTEWLGNELGYETIDRWYELTTETLYANYGRTMLVKCYSASPIKFVKAMFPEYEWLEWEFVNGVSNGYWEDIKNHKLYIEWLGDELGYETIDRWYELTTDAIYANFGGGLLSSYYSGSPIQFVKAMFPEYEWLEWKFVNVSNGYWEDIKNHKLYIEWLGDELGYETIDRWYELTTETLYANFGRGSLNIYYSPIQFVKAMFPEYEWLEWKFVTVHNGFWNDIKNKRRYMEWLGNELGYKTMEDWYGINKDVISENRGGGLLNHYGSKSSSCIMGVFPEHKWDAAKFKIKNKYSRGQIEWLEYLACSTPDMRHQLNHVDGEFIIPRTRYKADGYSVAENCIYEYHGDFWHGNLNIYDKNSMHPITRTTYGDLWEKTLKKQRCCENDGFTVHYIWESDWNRGKNAVILLQRLFRK